jgi:ketosteroid isomerase-like protein
MAESPEDLHIEFQQAFNRHDLDAILALYEPGAVLLSGGGPAHGKAAIRELYRGILAAHPTLELQTLVVTRAGDLAMLHGKWILYERGFDGRREGWNTEIARLHMVRGENSGYSGSKYRRCTSGSRLRGASGLPSTKAE